MLEKTQLQPSPAAIEFGRILTATKRIIEHLEGRDLRISAEYLLQLNSAGEKIYRPENTDEGFRGSLIQFAKDCADNPDLLMAVHNFLDVVARARSRRIHKQRSR
jgi:hypothetical protein